MSLQRRQTPVPIQNLTGGSHFELAKGARTSIQIITPALNGVQELLQLDDFSVLATDDTKATQPTPNLRAITLKKGFVHYVEIERTVSMPLPIESGGGALTRIKMLLAKYADQDLNNRTVLEENDLGEDSSRFITRIIDLTQAETDGYITIEFVLVEGVQTFDFEVSGIKLLIQSWQNAITQNTFSVPQIRNLLSHKSTKLIYLNDDNTLNLNNVNDVNIAFPTIEFSDETDFSILDDNNVAVLDGDLAYRIQVIAAGRIGIHGIVKLKQNPNVNAGNSATQARSKTNFKLWRLRGAAKVIIFSDVSSYSRDYAEPNSFKFYFPTECLAGDIFYLTANAIINDQIATLEPVFIQRNSYYHIEKLV